VKPDGFAVVAADGAFVGIWRDRDSAERIVNRSPSAKGERVRPMVFVDDIPPGDPLFGCPKCGWHGRVSMLLDGETCPSCLLVL
jgi:hypothetical protein